MRLGLWREGARLFACSLLQSICFYVMRLVKMNNEVRHFDLNIEKVLEHWTVAHALREVIANALDEQALTQTAAPLIMKDDEGRWHVQDFGRGLKYEHLTQK